jgi:hypothetical protein
MPWEVEQPSGPVERLPHTRLRSSTKAKAALCARCQAPVWYGHDVGPSVRLNSHPVSPEHAEILAANGRDIYYMSWWSKELAQLDPGAFHGEYNRDSLYVQHVCHGGRS